MSFSLLQQLEPNLPVRVLSHSPWWEPMLEHSLDGGVTVWLLDIDAEGDPGEPIDWKTELSPADLVRAAELRLPLHQQRFLRSRRALRQVLGKLLDLPPISLEWLLGPQGKPSLFPSAVATQLPFSLSRCERLMALAVGTAGDLGVDLELLPTFSKTQETDWLALSGTHFPPLKHAFLSALPAEQLPEQFLRLWTLREATAKATGVGIAAAEPLSLGDLLGGRRGAFSQQLVTVAETISAVLSVVRLEAPATIKT